MVPAPDTVRLLLVDDDERFPTYLRLLLGRTRTIFEMDAVSSVDAALRELATKRHHACLLDYRSGYVRAPNKRSGRSGIHLMGRTIEEAPPDLRAGGEPDSDGRLQTRRSLEHGAVCVAH